MNDILVYTKTYEERLHLLDKVLHRVEDNKMFPKLAKCKFAVQMIKYLRHEIGQDGVQPFKDKVEAVAH